MESDEKIKHQRLTLEERKKIYVGLQQGKTANQISREIGRGRNTVNSEIRINGGATHYDPFKAHELYEERKSSAGRRNSFSHEKKMQIYKYIKEGKTTREIARLLCKNIGSVNNEIFRGGGRTVYNPYKTHTEHSTKALEGSQDTRGDVPIVGNETLTIGISDDIRKRLEVLEMHIETLYEMVKEMYKSNG